MDHQQKDETAVAYLATAMNTKLARARAKGRSGWDTPECTQQHLSNLLREHVEKGDPVDVANFCAFLAARGEGIAPRQCLAQIEEPAGAAPAAAAPFGYVNTQTGQFFTDVEPCRRGNEGHWRTVYLQPSAVAGAVATGWRLVPATPTREWIASVADGGYEDCDCASLIADILSRAPAAPALEAPPAVAPQGEYPHEQMDAMALARYKVVPSHASMLWSHAVVAGDGAQQLYVGREVECQNMARKFAGAFLDGAFAFHSMAAAPTAQAATALEAPAAPACDEEAAYKKWFQGEQGKPYHTMWDFARAAWMARAALAAAPQAPAQEAPAAPGTPPGFALVPMRLTRAMDEVLEEEGWQWEDLLAAACAITESDHAAISRDEPSDGEIKEAFEAYGAEFTDKHLEAVREIVGNALAAAPQAPAAASALATQVIENLLQLARIVNVAVEDWGETKEDDSLHVIFHKEQADKLEEILEFFDSLPDAPPEEGVILSGPSRAARVLRAMAAPAAPAVDAETIEDAARFRAIANAGLTDDEAFDRALEKYPELGGDATIDDVRAMFDAARAAVAAQAKKGGE